jgi:hypothetical protein
VIAGELKGKIDRIWDAFWSGGIASYFEWQVRPRSRALRDAGAAFLLAW